MTRSKHIYSTIEQTVSGLLDGHDDNAAVAEALFGTAMHTISVVSDMTPAEVVAELKKMRTAIDQELRSYEEEPA
jgi:hypothetical protein